MMSKKRYTQENLIQALKACETKESSLRQISKAFGVPRTTLHDRLAEKQKKKSKYTQENLFAALKTLKEDKKASMRQVSKTFGIPRATLHDKLSGRRQLHFTPGVLDESEEKELAEWFKEMPRRGCTLSKADVLINAKRYLDFKDKKTRWADNMPGEQWYLRFRKRHPDIDIPKFSKYKTKFTEYRLMELFSKLEDIVYSFDPDILTEPTRIFNAGETDVIRMPAQSADEIKRDQNQTTTSETKMATVLMCVNADGYFTDPMIIYPPTLFREYSSDEILAEFLVTKSETSWTNGDLFGDWLQTVFIPQTMIIKKPLLLLVDNHLCFHSFRVGKLCKENNIIIYSLPPRESNKLYQPLDFGISSLLETEWREINRQRAEMDDAPTKMAFIDDFRDVYQNVTRRTPVVQEGFKKSGIFPFNPRCRKLTNNNNNIFASNGCTSTFTSSNNNSPSNFLGNSCQSFPNSTTSIDLQQRLAVTEHSLKIKTEPAVPVGLFVSSSTSTTAAPGSSSLSTASVALGNQDRQEDQLRELLLLAAKIGEKDTEKYLRMMDEGFHGIEADPVYDTWRECYGLVTQQFKKC